MADPLALVVDDDLDILDALSARLRAAGFRVATARSGEEAVEALDKEKPSVLILEIALGGKNGFEVCRYVREGISKKTPIFFFTTKDEPADRYWAENLNATGYFTKPFALDALLQSVKEAVRPQA